MKDPKLLTGLDRLSLSLLPASLLALPVVLFDLWNLRAMLRLVRAGDGSGDSWNAMRSAWRWFASPHQGNLYQQVFFESHTKFQYPPSSLLLFRFGAIFHREFGNLTLNWVSYAMLILEAVAAGCLAYAAVRELASPERKNQPSFVWTTWAITLTAALLTLDFGPAVIAAALGQVQTWINAWFVVACLCWVKDRRFLAGLCIGAICIFKPQFSLFLLWGAFRRERSFLLGWATVVLPLGALSLTTFGIANHLDYIPTLQFLSKRGEAYYANQSMNGLLNRFLGNGDSIVFEPDGFPPYHPVVYVGAFLTTVVLIGSALLYRVRSRRVTAMDFSIAGLTFTLASPIAWHHHYGFLPVILLLLGITLYAVGSPLKRGALACVLVVLWASVSHWGPPLSTPRTGFITLIESSLFLGCLGILGMLYLFRDTYADRIAPRLERIAAPGQNPNSLKETAEPEPEFETN